MTYRVVLRNTNREGTKNMTEKTETRVRSSFTMLPTLYKQVKEEAEKEKLPVSGVIEKALVQYFNNKQ